MALGSNVLSTSIDILVVDDDVDVRGTICELLSAEGYRVTQAVNGSDALKKLAAPGFNPALIVLDILMPVMNGCELLVRLRRDTRLNAVPVLVLSASLDLIESDVSVPKLQKPVDSENLLRSIKRYQRQYTQQEI